MSTLHVERDPRVIHARLKQRDAALSAAIDANLRRLERLEEDVRRLRLAVEALTVKEGPCISASVR